MTLPLRIRREKRARMMPPKDTAPIRCKGHRNWVGEHGCCVPTCGARPVEVAHVRTGTNGGKGMKPGDDWTISLCVWHHRTQHHLGEPEFERAYGIDMKALAMEFAAKSPFRSKFKAKPIRRPLEDVEWMYEPDPTRRKP